MAIRSLLKTNSMKREYQKPSVDVYELKMRGNLLLLSDDPADPGDPEDWGQEWEDMIDDFFNA